LDGTFFRMATKFPGSPPFGNVYSFVDGPCHNSTGVPYFYGTYMDQSFQDILSNPSVSFTLSEASLSSVCGGSSLSGCQTHDSGGGGDPENPLCARLTLVGKLRQVLPSEEYDMALNALFQRHRSFPTWPRNHNWVVAKLDVEHIWFIDYFGGADIMDVTQYFSTALNENDPYQHNDELDPNESK
jgi:Pyridoxamine 5'-phosphate oxidase